MFSDKKMLYIVTATSLVALLLAFLLPGEHSGRIVAALLLLPLAIGTHFLVKKRSILSMNRKTVTMLFLVIGIVWLVLCFLAGAAFGFHTNPHFFDLRYLLPTAAIIFATELIRSVVRAQSDKWADVLCYLTCLLADALTFGNLRYLNTFNRFIDFLALTVFPAVVANLVYHYTAKRYGVYPNLVYRLLTTLYAYLIPWLPAIPDALFALAKLFVPILIYAFVDALYEKKRRYALAKRSKLSPVITVIAVLIVTGFIMLISNRFRYGALVIATKSMTGELNQGDVSIFTSYDGEPIEKGAIIVFDHKGSMIVHRVVDIERIDGQYRYFTKGDANEDMDAGYVERHQIRGVVNFKVPYVGYPTLWLRGMFE